MSLGVLLLPEDRGSEAWLPSQRPGEVVVVHQSLEPRRIYEPFSLFTACSVSNKPFFLNDLFEKENLDFYVF